MSNINQTTKSVTKPLWFWSVPLNRNQFGQLCATYEGQPTHLQYVAYSDNLSFVDYQALYTEFEFETGDYDEFEAIYNQWHRIEYEQTKLTEIIKSDFWESLECLPPQRWCTIGGVEFFYCMEAYSGDVHSFYFSCNDRYATAKLNKNISDKDLLKLWCDFSNYTPI